MAFATPDDARLALERAPASGFRWRPFAQARDWAVCDEVGTRPDPIRTRRLAEHSTLT